ncbi:MAG: hypothetical protein RL438_1042, partial [Actinomycetota bacterium]
MTEAVAIALTTLPSREEADRLAADAVAAGLAACAQVDGPIRSHYTWEGKVESEDEFRVTFKHAASKGADLESPGCSASADSMDLTAAKALLYCALGLFVLVAWARERRKRTLNGGPEKFWPGTTYAPSGAYFVAAAGAI